MPWSATPSSNTSGTSSATSSCAGDSRRSAASGWCRRPPGSAIRSTSSTWPRWSPPGTAPPSPTRWWAPTRTRRWSTAWAWWAGVSAASRPRRRCWASPSRCSSPRLWGSGSRASCPRAPPPPISSSPSPTFCAPTGSWGASSSSTARAWPTCRWRTGPRSGTCLPSTARRSRSSRSTTRRCATCASPADPTSSSPWSRRTRRNRACGTMPPPSRRSPRPSNSTCPPSSPVSPGPPAPRTGCRCGRRSGASRWHSSTRCPTRPANPSPGRSARRRHAGGDRARLRRRGRRLVPGQ